MGWLVQSPVLPAEPAHTRLGKGCPAGHPFARVYATRSVWAPTATTTPSYDVSASVGAILSTFGLRILAAPTPSGRTEAVL